jgi:hypothetical protein
MLAAHRMLPAAAKRIAYRDAVMALSPTAFWRLGSDTTWGTNGIVDASGNGHHGNGTSTTFTLNQPGLLSDGDKAVIVPGSGGGIRVTQASWMENAKVTIAIAFKISTAPGTGVSYALLSRRSFGGAFPWAIYINGSSNTNATPTSPAGGAYMVTAINASLFHEGASTGVSVCDGNKHLLVATLDSSDGSHINSVLYLDGIQTGSVSLSGTYPTSGTLVNGSDLQIGSEWSGSFWNRQCSGGTLDEVGYWAGTVLNSTQVSNLWAAFNA